MLKHIEKIKFCALLLVAFIGFATGINYYKIVRIDDISSIKNCFEFGLYPLFDGNTNSKLFMSLILSSIKHYIVFIIGMFNWLFFIVGILNLFGLSFKLGVSVKCAFSLIGIKGIVSNFLLVLMALFIILVCVLLFYIVLNIRIYRLKGVRINYTDIEFIKKSFISLIIFVIVIFLFLLMLKYTNSRLYGLLNTIL